MVAYLVQSRVANMKANVNFSLFKCNWQYCTLTPTMTLIYCRLWYSYLKKLLNPSLTYLSGFSDIMNFSINRIIIFLKHFNKSGNDSKHQILFTGKYKIKLICVSTMINLRNHTNFNYFICLFNSKIDWLTGCFRHIDSISAI